jgi:signal transduction histidine kinase
MELNRNFRPVASKLDKADWSAFVLALTGLLLFAPVSVQAAGPQRVTTFSQLYSLAPEDLAERRPVEIDTVVLSFDADWGQFFVNSSPRTVFINPAGLSERFGIGDLVRITGVTAPEPITLPITNLSVTRLGSSTLPVPKVLNVAQLSAAQGWWVEVVAAVRTAETSRGRLALVLGSGGATCLAYVMGALPTNNCKSYVGSTVRVRGIVTAPSGQNGRTESIIIVPGIAQMDLLHHAATSIVELPVISIDALLNRELGDWTNAMVHLNGIVTDAKSGESILLRDPTGMLLARVWQANEALPGQRIDVWGYLQLSDSGAVLADAYWEPIHSSAGFGSLTHSAIASNSAVAYLTNLPGVRALGREELGRGLPVQLRGLVLYSDPEWHTAFISDGHTALYAEITQSNIVAGHMVDLTGQAATGAFGPAIMATHFEVRGNAELPAAIPAELDDLADGHLDAQWVEMRGVVRQTAASWNHLHVSVMTRRGRFNVIVPAFSGTNPPPGLLDSRVIVRGICGSDLNARNQLRGITVYVPELRQIETVEAAPADPFAKPTVPISAVATFDPEQVAGQRVKVAGVVTLKVPGQGLFLEDRSGGIRVQMPPNDAAQVEPGDYVEVLGFPSLGEFSPHLEEPLIRRLNESTLPVPIACTAEQVLLQGTNDGRLVTVEAELLQGIPRSANPRLVLQQGPIIFTAQLGTGRFTEDIQHLRPGSLLRLTGVCLMQGAEEHAAQSFRLLLRSPAAVQLLKSPPRLSSQDVLMIGGAVAVIALGALGWIAILRRQVRARTADLHASQGSLQTEVHHTRALSELGRRLNAAATPKDAARIIVNVADDLIGWDACVCDMYDSETGLVTHVLSLDILNGERTECQPRSTQTAPSALARRAMELGPQLILRESAPAQQLEVVPFGDFDRRSASILYVPIRNDSQVVGFVSVQSYRSKAYSEKDLTILRALADHCSGALARIRANEQLVEISRRAGMAEVATGVLHNVGNVLTSVNVSTHLLRERLKDSYADGLARVASLLKEHSHDLAGFLAADPKGQKIPDYLEQLVAHMSANEGQVRAELQSLSKNIEHIKEIIVMQQSFARVAGVAQTMAVTELIEDALRLNAVALQRHEVEVFRDYPPNSPPITVDKHKVLQILVNLIRNAKYACEESECPERKLSVGLTNHDGRIRIRVADNGVGIAPENLTRIFSLGFSTRKDGHGFGLHSAAVAARELGGGLAVHSDGPGTGAVFTLELPQQPPK